MRDVKEFINKDGEPSVTNPDAASSRFFTNHFCHYFGDRTALQGNMLAVYPYFAKFPIPLELFHTINLALNNYGNVPLIQFVEEIKT